MLAAALLLAGCAGLGEGLGRAVLSQIEGDPGIDTRACEIQGAPFDGILVALQAQDGQGRIGVAPASQRSVVKLMIVHGVGSHHPGYSGRTVANLTGELGLNVVSPQIKSVDLIHPDFPGESNGTLTAQRFTDDAGERELVVYELTWSRISDHARANLRFDSSQIHTRHRAPLNQLGKTFVNDVLVDPLVYVGVGRDKILTAVRQGMCWAYSTDWDGFPEAPLPCRQDDPQYGSRLPMDRFFFVTHSLGSRIVLDALETSAEGIYVRMNSDAQTPPFLTDLRDHTVTVFMLANQLPLLQAGFPPVPVTGQIKAYCLPDGLLYERRIVTRTRVIAFSDPNDLLSYPIPEDFVQYGIDSRLCPTVVNMSLNIARVSRVLARDGFANPLTAHTGYNDDMRVIGLMAGGLGSLETAPTVTERCNWVRVDESLR
jgi:hypothetical protein